MGSLQIRSIFSGSGYWKPLSQPPNSRRSSNSQSMIYSHDKVQKSLEVRGLAPTLNVMGESSVHVHVFCLLQL